jgi:phage host-nuclease inhibitor protein Gam
MATTPDPLDRLDELTRTLAEVQAQILEIVAKSLIDYQAVDAKHSPQLNPLYRQAQDLFDEAHGIADAHRSELLSRERKSAKRNAGTLGWRANPHVVKHVSTEVLVGRIKAMGQTISRKLLRRTVTWDLRLESIKAAINKEIVASIDGLEVIRTDEFYLDPKNGLRMSTAKPYWPNLEGITGSPALSKLFLDPDE